MKTPHEIAIDTLQNSGFLKDELDMTQKVATRLAIAKAIRADRKQRQEGARTHKLERDLVMTHTARIANGVRAIIEKMDPVPMHDEEQILILEWETGVKQWAWHIDIEVLDLEGGEWESAGSHRIEYAPTPVEAIAPWVDEIREEFRVQE